MAMAKKIEVHSEQAMWRRDQRAIAIFLRDDTGREWLAEPLKFNDVTDTLCGPSEYTITDGKLGMAFLQAVLEHAWSIGLRPVGFSDVPLQVGAMKEHLNDMRAIAFGVIGRPIVAPSFSDADIAAMRGPGAIKEKP